MMLKKLSTFGKPIWKLRPAKTKALVRKFKGKRVKILFQVFHKRLEILAENGTKPTDKTPVDNE